MTTRLVKKPCTECGKKFPAKQINRRGHCKKCAEKLHRQAVHEMQTKKGPLYEKYLSRMRAYYNNPSIGR